MKQIISREIALDYGHTLPNHFSFCNQIHGHRAKVICYFEGDVCTESGSSSQGMVLDFKICKEIMMEKIHDKLDHGFAVWEKDTETILVDKNMDGNESVALSTLEFIRARNSKILITEQPPTAEYLAQWAFIQVYIALNKRLAREGVELVGKLKLVRIQWFETPNNCAEFNLSNYKEWMEKLDLEKPKNKISMNEYSTSYVMK